MKLSHRRQFLHLAAGAAALPVLSRTAGAQGYPTRPVTMVAPMPPGGTYDAIARIVAERMRASLGHPIIIENVAGAAGGIGVGRVARATNDGYTVLVGGFSTNVLNGALYDLPYDVVTDFEPISLLITSSLMIVGRKTLPADDLRQLIAWLKANPDKASQGTTGAATHVAGVSFQKESGTRFQFVPYRGGAQAMQDLMAGQIDLMIDSMATFLPQVRAGSIKAFAVASKTRFAIASEIPTVDKAGLSGFYAPVWYGLFAPRGTSADIVAKLNAAARDALADSAVAQRFAPLGLTIAPRELQSPEAFRALQKADVEKWWPIIRAANIKGE